jgi:hypothetical protein
MRFLGFTVLLSCVNAFADEPPNVVLERCTADNFSLRVSGFETSDTNEIGKQLAIGLLTRGHALCRGEENPIRIERSHAGATVVVRYRGETLVRNVVVEREDPARALTVALAAEELALIATDPLAPRPLPPPPRLRLGLAGNAVAYADTHVGFRFGGRVDAQVVRRLRLGFELAGGHVVSDASAAGQTRYSSVELQVAGLTPLVRGRRLQLFGGVALAPGVVFARSDAGSGFTAVSKSAFALSARALVDLDIFLTEHQTLVLRVGGGRPLVGVDTRADNGTQLGGLATWEALFGVAWLWSFY